MRKEAGLELNAERSVPPVNTVPRGQMESLSEEGGGLRAERGALCCTSQHRTTWSEGSLVRGRRRGLELNAERCNTERRWLTWTVSAVVGTQPPGQVRVGILTEAVSAQSAPVVRRAAVQQRVSACGHDTSASRL